MKDLRPPMPWGGLAIGFLVFPVLLASLGYGSWALWLLGMWGKATVLAFLAIGWLVLWLWEMHRTLKTVVTRNRVGRKRAEMLARLEREIGRWS